MEPKTILVIGSGGREHALAWRLRHEGHHVLAAPGSDAIAAEGVCHSVDIADHGAVAELARRHAVDLVLVGPEKPLVDGLADDLRAAGLAVFGPGAAAARLEGSKADAKAFMHRHGIPTARSTAVDTLQAGLQALDTFDGPPVVKADGLAAGKGVTVPGTQEEAEAALRACLEDEQFGTAGRRVVLEQRLRGRELSVFAITDGHHAVLLPPVRDHKRLLDGGVGPNTGGMGAIAPVADLAPDLMDRVRQSIVTPTLAGLRAEGRPYVGVLFVGLMIDDAGNPWVIEYNCRFGDPEIQPVVFGLDGELFPALWAAARGGLTDGVLTQRPSAVVVMAAAGYPVKPRLGDPIRGLEALVGVPDVQVFHAGTRKTEQAWVSAGGRVLGVCARGNSIEDAVARAYRGVDQIHWAGAQVRRDIGTGVG